VIARVAPAGERHRVTTFELFFDLVYVFAVTRVTAYMAEAHSGEGVLQGFLLLGLLWWTWAGYSWLGNQARADEGLTRLAMAAAMAAVFVVALAIPEAWEDAPGGLNGPVVLVCAYFFVRVLHLSVYAVAAAGDPGLRRQLAITVVPMLAGTALLLAGVLLGGRTQIALFACALTVDWAGTYVTSREGEWRIHSPLHWSERHGLFVILAIGESIVAIGAGAAELPVGAALVAGAVLGIAISVLLWWLYFDVVSVAAEHALSQLDGRARVSLAVEAYSYLHFPLIAGIVLTALGVEEALAHVGDGKALGWFAAAALHAGLVLYLLGHVAFKRRLHGAISRPRMVTAAALGAATPLSASVVPLAALALVVVVVGVLAAFETGRYGHVRRSLRQTHV
jgi:low temperature requirement protein LtrA